MSRAPSQDDGWVLGHDPGQQHVELTYPMLQVLRKLPGSCWNVLSFMMQESYVYVPETNQYRRSSAPMAVRFIANGTELSNTTVVATLKTLRELNLIILVAAGTTATEGQDGVPAEYSVNWNFRLREHPDGIQIDGVEEVFRSSKQLRLSRQVGVEGPSVPESGTLGVQEGDAPSVPEIGTLRTKKLHASVPESDTPAYQKVVQRSEEKKEGNDHSITPVSGSGSVSFDLVVAWRNTLEELEMSMTKATFVTHFSDSRAVSFAKGELVLRLRSVFSSEWVQERLTELVLRCARSHMPGVASLVCTHPPVV